MMFVVGHAEVLVYFSVDGENSRSGRGVSSDIAELPDRGFDEGGRIEPPRGSLVRGSWAEPRCVRPVISSLGDRVVQAAYRKALRYPALKRQNPAHLPTAD